MKNHSKIFKFLLLILFVSCISLLDVNAQKKKISIQGFLKDANGKAVADGIQLLTFKIYTAASGETALWSEDQSLKVIGGVYAAQLGSVVDMSTLTWKIPHFVGVTVQGIELIPRTELTYSPYSLSTQTVVCSGALGDVKYSILNPTQFADVNGDCWVPMDGRSMVGSILATKIGGSNVPNGSGLFLRGQEFPNGIDNDNGRDSNTLIGTVENQDTQPHQHGFSGNTSGNGNHSHTVSDSYFTGTENDWRGGGSSSGGYVGNSNIQTQTTNASGDHTHNFSGTTGNNNGNPAETRPKNLNFWTYIRIN